MRLRDAELIQRPLDPQPVGAGGLAQQVAEITFLAALAFARGRNSGFCLRMM
ncbi:hypothetical protein [Mesorhizobium sp. WSM4983]|uniref:hypothetical protein n=1 Tax=Mesorhizobium sp. WSM4983 TaxID=3038540 RepID=UPI003FA552B5